LGCFRRVAFPVDFNLPLIIVACSGAMPPRRRAEAPTNAPSLKKPKTLDKPMPPGQPSIMAMVTRLPPHPDDSDKSIPSVKKLNKMTTAQAHAFHSVEGLHMEDWNRMKQLNYDSWADFYETLRFSQDVTRGIQEVMKVVFDETDKTWLTLVSYSDSDNEDSGDVVGAAGAVDAAENAQVRADLLDRMLPRVVVKGMAVFSCLLVQLTAAQKKKKYNDARRTKAYQKRDEVLEEHAAWVAFESRQNDSGVFWCKHCHAHPALRNEN
jgi:hypothetical protein